MAIRWDKLTVKAQEAVQRGNELASEHGNPELLPLHLLAALLEDSDLMAELSLMEREHLQGARAALSPLFPIVDARDMEDTANES